MHDIHITHVYCSFDTMIPNREMVAVGQDLEPPIRMPDHVL